MSLFREEHLECPYCYHDVLFTLYSSINVGLHPELKERFWITVFSNISVRIVKSLI